LTITSAALLRIIQEQRCGWTAVQRFGQKKNNSCTWWIAFAQCSKTRWTSQHVL